MKFNESNHTYFNDAGEQYLSCTSLIKKYCKPFDKQKIATKYAKKHKRKVQDVLDEWEKAGSDAVKKGLAFHSMKESELNGKETVLIDEEEHTIIKAEWHDGVKINNTLKLDAGIYPELIVWSDRYKVAGQVDLTEVTKKGYLNVKDYKTSKEIKQHAFERWDGTKEMMKFPLHNLEDCNFNHYALQINLYAFLIKQQNRNLKLGKLYIEHIIGEFDELTNEFSNLQMVLYKVPNMQDEIRILLEYHKNND